MRSTLSGAVGACAIVGSISLTSTAHAGPYAPAAGQPGSTAVSKDSPSISAWATGHVDYLPGAGVTAPFNTPSEAYGPAEGQPGEIVSLGDTGRITLTFANPIADGPGADFAVFENSFSDTFLELAWVEVSADGTNFVRFANDSLTANPVPFLGGSIDPTNLNGLAGKYRGGFGTPFDLAELGLAQVTHVRLVDVIGDGTALDTSGDVIYDPYPTTGSAGFDLDAVGVINQVPEPSGVAVLSVSALALATRRRRRATLSAFAASVLCLTTAPALLAQTADFQDLPLAPNSFYNGSDGAGGFTTGGVTFSNNYNTSFGYWSGFAYSNKTDTTTAGFGNQYSAIPGAGAGGSSTYGLSYAGGNDAVVTLPAGRTVASASFANTTYAYLSMRDGDGFAKKFGGASGADPDFFKLTINGLNDANGVIGSVEFYLADFRSPVSAEDFIRTDWTNVDLSSLSAARKLSFELSSSDNGTFGMNTPAYFAIDDLVTVPEPGTIALLGVASLTALRRRRH